VTDRAAFLAATGGWAQEVSHIAAALIRAASPNPPGETRAAAEAAAAMLREAAPDAELLLHEAAPGILNLVARVTGSRPGRRIVLNGHLDTYPVNEALPWTVDPLGGAVRDGRLYGRGAADMKGGIAASMVALSVLAEHRDKWPGEAVLTLGGDEETMGPLGTQWLMENVPHAVGDAVIIGDAGSPEVLRFGEKGFVWMEVEAAGRPAHGAHVHLGINAYDRLRRALDALEGLRALPVAAPAAVTEAIAAARDVSEALSGAGECAVLGSVTVNIGRVDAGTSMNLIPAAARASVDIRLPVGVTGDAALAAVGGALDGMEGISWRVLRRVEPSFTDPAGELVGCVRRSAEDVLGHAPVANVRVGGSDARLFRAAGIPAVVYGPTPFNMGGADEYVLVSELDAVARVHALAAFDFLTA